jgi:hypothetical protein
MRLPFAPLDELAKHEGIVHVEKWLRISGSHLDTLRERGLTIAYADRLAVRIGRHPSELWGDAVWSDLDEWVSA